MMNEKQHLENIIEIIKVDGYAETIWHLLYVYCVHHNLIEDTSWDVDEYDLQRIKDVLGNQDE